MWKKDESKVMNVRKTSDSCLFDTPKNFMFEKYSWRDSLDIIKLFLLLKTYKNWRTMKFICKIFEII